MHNTKIGICRIDENKKIIELQRGPLRQGWGFKDSFAFFHKPKFPCYVPELSDTVYTKEDILALCDGQESLARKIFCQLDWQLPEVLLDEELQEKEISICRRCKRMFESYWLQTCPHCGLDNNTEST